LSSYLLPFPRGIFSFLGVYILHFSTPPGHEYYGFLPPSLWCRVIERSFFPFIFSSCLRSDFLGPPAPFQYSPLFRPAVSNLLSRFFFSVFSEPETPDRRIFSPHPGRRFYPPVPVRTLRFFQPGQAAFPGISSSLSLIFRDFPYFLVRPALAGRSLTPAPLF